MQGIRIRARTGPTSKPSFWVLSMTSFSEGVYTNAGVNMEISELLCIPSDVLEWLVLRRLHPSEAHAVWRCAGDSRWIKGEQLSKVPKPRIFREDKKRSPAAPFPRRCVTL